MSLGLDRLKSALMALGLKCGGLEFFQLYLKYNVIVTKLINRIFLLLERWKKELNVFSVLKVGQVIFCTLGIFYTLLVLQIIIYRNKFVYR